MSEEDDKKVELDTGDAVETEVEFETPEVEDKGTDLRAQADNDSDDGEDNFDKAHNNTQKRIDRLTKKMRTAEREREEALRYAQQVQAQAQELEQRMSKLNDNYVQQYSGRVETELAGAEADLARAMDLGDTAAVVAAQRKITNLAIQSDRAQQAQIQQQRQQQQYQAQRQSQASQPMPAQQPPRPDPKAESWAERNSWFGEDEAMTYAAFGIHKKLVDSEQFDPSSDEYYDELDKRMAEEFPHKFKNSGASRRPAQKVASGSRTTSGRNTKVRLSPSQVAIAKKLGVPLEEYAKYVK
jgi:hypothetical protein